MTIFQFTALDKDGSNQKGSIEADTAKQVRQQLRAKGLMPITVEGGAQQSKPVAGKIPSSRVRISRREITLITRQLSTLLEGGIPLEKALQLMAKQHEKPKVRNILLSIASKIKEGYSLSESMANFPLVFSEIYRASVAAGEHAGCLDQALVRLADYSEASNRNMEKIQLALLYPAILLVVSMAAVTFLLGYVMPNIVRVFEDSEKELPALTIIVMQASYFVRHYGIYAALAGGALIILFLYSIRSEKHRREFHKKLYNISFIGKWESAINISNFLKTFSVLHKNGVPIVRAIQMGSKVIKNLYLRDKFIEAAQNIKEGKSLSAALGEIKYFPPTALYMIASGESGGHLDDMLDRASRDQESWLQGKISMIVGMFEPMMILVMGVIVLIFVLAILLPILNYSQVVK